MAYSQQQGGYAYNSGVPPQQPQWQQVPPQQHVQQPWQPAQPIQPVPQPLGVPIPGAAPQPLGGMENLGNSGLEAGQVGPDWSSINPATISRFGALGFGASAETMINASSTFAQQTYAKYLSGEALRYYFTVNQRYVIKKLQMLWCPILFKGHWNRSHEQVVGGSAYRPPALDFYAPDLYLPLMGFLSYCMICCVSDLLHKGVFAPERAGRYLWWASLAWIVLVGVMWFGIQSVGGGNLGVSFLDASANAGYMFIIVSGECALGFFSRHVYYAVYTWGTLTYFLFLVKTLRRDLAGTSRLGGVGASKKKLAILVVALSQAPISLWLGRLPRTW